MISNNGISEKADKLQQQTATVTPTQHADRQPLATPDKDTKSKSKFASKTTTASKKDKGAAEAEEESKIPESLMQGADANKNFDFTLNKANVQNA